MAWLHAVRFPWSGLRCGIPFTTGSQGFPETWLDVKMQKLFYQTSTPVFRSNCFFNSLLRCRAPTTIQKTLGKVCIQFRKFVCCIVGPPPRTNWSAQWHDILHGWNMRVDHWSHASGISWWSKKCMTQFLFLTLQICLPNAG